MNLEQKIPRGLIISAPCSGAGKTTVTLGLLAALKRRGVDVRAAKSGPDFIDPAFHAAASGRDSVNLDGWAMPPALLDQLAVHASADADLLLIEGAMGLFDGAPGPRSGAVATLAARWALPVLLVLDVHAQFQSAAAVVRGFATHQPDVRIGGVILNRVAGERHRAPIADAIAALGIPVLGAIPRDAALTLPERHLGLMQAQEHRDLDERLSRLADMADAHCDLDAIVALASPLIAERQDAIIALPPPGQRIALACDAAFSFIYPHLIEEWRHAGAEIVAFSPLADEPPPDDCDACWLPGGYPELHAGALATTSTFRDGLAQFARTRAVHGECGGYMVLGESLEDQHGTHHAMTGLLSHATSFARRKLHLGYREARMIEPSPLGPAGTIVRGHEFHYATLTSPGHDTPLVDLVDTQDQRVAERGGRRGYVTGTFFHAIARIDR